MATSQQAQPPGGWLPGEREHLAGADLHLAALSSAPLPGADLQGATFSPETAWPAGFDPLAAGARRA